MVRTAKKLTLINIEHRMKELSRYFSGSSLITAVFIYGSYGTESQTNLSDVDLALLLSNDNVSLDDELKISAEISSLAGEDDINVVIMNRAPLTLQYKILSTGTLIYEKDSNRLNGFTEFVIKRYLDYAIDLDNFYRDYDQSLREAYLVEAMLDIASHIVAKLRLGVPKNYSDTFEILCNNHVHTDLVGAASFQG